MAQEISKTYDPAAIESPIYAMWLKERCFAADVNAPGEPYCIVIPPPNVTGALHLGHAINNTLQDILIRVHRMRGFNTLWMPGIDHAGIATQAVVEKQLKEKENLTRHQVGREGLVKRIWEWKEQYGNRILEQLKRLGCSCDWDRTRFTLDEQCARAVRETFFKLFKDGLIYRGKRLINWDIHLQTSISDDEIYHETVKTNLWHIKYPIVSTSGGNSGRQTHMTVATTRPETMLGDTAVAVHSEDPRWNWAIGQFVELPLTGRKIPIIADDILVDPKFGSGVVKVTPGHDPNDYAVWQRHQGKPDQIEILDILNPDGTINQIGGQYAGMKREAARKKIVADLTAAGLLEKEEPYETQVGHSDRSKTAIEPLRSDQWFVKMADLAEPALKVVREHIVKFFPERHAQQYLSWLGEKRDWPISRQLWWGHRIPVWRREMTNAECVALFEGSHRFAGLLMQDEKTNVAVRVLTETESYLVTGHRKHLECLGSALEDSKDKPISWMICPESDSIDIDGQPINTWLENHGFIQDPDVLDTWFSSGLWPHSTLGWPDDTPDLRKWYPGNVLVTSREIITLWVARMVMTGLYNMGKVPFHHVYVHTTILDGHGQRMSKSAGNGVDPVDVIEAQGADALRFTLTQMATETQDVRLPVKKDAKGRNSSEKFDLGSRFCNKIWQVANFFVMSNLEKIAPEPVDESKWSLADRWIVSRFNRTMKEADEAIANYRFDQYSKICYDFFYADFCDWYVEASKPALRDPAKAGQTANILAAILDGSLRLMHPMIPFITETLWGRLCEIRPERGLPGWVMGCTCTRLILASWPKPGRIDDRAADFDKIQEVISGIRKFRNEYKIDVKNVLDVSFVADGAAKQLIQENRAAIEHLAGCRINKIEKALNASEGARVIAGGYEVLIVVPKDDNAESQRISKRRDELAKLTTTLKGRLANESYTSRAPAHLVQQTKDQLAEAEAELAKLG